MLHGSERSRVPTTALPNLARRDFAVDLELPSIRVHGTYSSVEALYQGLKFTVPEQFAVGGALEGDACA